jgi:HEAT repeat protein
MLNAQNFQTRKKPISLEADKNANKAIALQINKNILKNNRINNILLEAQNANEGKRLEAIEKLGYINNEKGRILLEKYVLKDSSIDIRLECIKSLGVLQSVKSKNTLILALKDTVQNIKIYAAFALALLGEKEECFKVFKELWNKNENVPYYSCHQGFLYIGTPEVKPFLIQDLQNKDQFVAIDAAIILAEIGYGEDAIPFIKKSLEHSDKYMRMAALRSLSYIGDNNSINLIKSMTADEDNLVRERTTSILKAYNIQ